MNTIPTALTSISVAEARQNILANFAALTPVQVPLMEALGLVLAEDVHSDIDMPPFDNSSMDGYALRAADVRGASPGTPTALRLAGYLPAGAAPGPDDRVSEGAAFRIMTGAPVPPGADAVIPFEETSEGRGLRGESVQPGQSRANPIRVGDEVLIYKSLRSGDYIRRRGEDVMEGASVLDMGKPLRPADVGLLAAVGRSEVLVYPRPRVVILATGDELVDVWEKPGPGQIRNSNNYAIEAQLQSWGAVTYNLGVARDNKAHLTAKLREALALHPDLLVTSAGVSVGDYDIVKEVLLSMGSIDIWRVRVKPGKPLVFGRLGQDGVPFLGLPGNPVSSMVTMELFGRPVIMKMLGRERLLRPTVQARVLEALDNRGGRTHYMRGIVTRLGDEYQARLAGRQESNILTGMSRANALLEVDESVSRIEAGEMATALMIDWQEEVG